MNRTRIVVPAIPTELDAPHFDDEVTIVTARPVVPIARAKAVERSRISILILAGLLTAGLSGAAGAFGIIYYRDHRSNSLSSGLQQTDQPQASQSQPAVTSTTESSTTVVASHSPSPEPATGQQATLPANQTDSSLDKKTDTALIQKDDSQIVKRVTSPSVSDKGDTPPSDPSHLVRKRRVHPLNESSAQRIKPAKSKDRGAGRILEIFEGPNPP